MTLYLTTHNISSAWRRFMLVLVAALVALTAMADAPAPWDGTTMTAPTLLDPLQKNSALNPYIIDTPAKLAMLRHKNWSAKKYYYLQTCDLDMGNHDFMYEGHCIGYSLDNTNNYGFAGVYDGSGYTVRNVLVDWTQTASTNYVFIGFFSVVNAGTITNLTLENYHLTCSGPRKVLSTEFSVSLGAIVGLLLNDSVLDNINLVNCVIDDGGYDFVDGDTNNKVKAYYAGAIAQTRATHASGVGTSHTVHNVAVDLRIDLRHTRRNINNSDDTSLFNVGLLFGRMNKGVENREPARNVFVSGEINAPYAVSAGPLWGFSSANESYTKFANITRQYVGSFDGSNTFAANHAATYGQYVLDYYDYDYSAWTEANPTEGVRRRVTATDPTGTGCLLGSRTFRANNENATLTKDNSIKPNELARWHGYNAGVYGKTPEEATEILTADSPSGMIWQWDGTRFYLSRLFPRVAVEQTDVTTFHAVLSNGLEDRTYTLRWYGSTDGVNFDAVPTQTDDLEYRYTRVADCTFPEAAGYTHIRVDLYDPVMGMTMTGRPMAIEEQTVVSATLKRTGFDTFQLQFKLNFGTMTDPAVFWWGHLHENNEQVDFDWEHTTEITVPAMNLYGTINARIGDKIATFNDFGILTMTIAQLTSINVQATVHGAHRDASYKYLWEYSTTLNGDDWQPLFTDSDSNPVLQGSGQSDLLSMNFDFDVHKRVRCTLYAENGQSLAAVVPTTEPLEIQELQDLNFAGGYGTPQNPYLIATYDQLAYLQSRPDYWDLCFMQTADIDIPVESAMGMIGYGMNNDGDFPVDHSKPFTGHYDGRGHKITGRHLVWDNPVMDLKYDRVAYGLFGYIRGGSVINLHLDGFTISRPSNCDATYANRHLRMGILAGVVGEGSVVENIIITNSSIIDNGAVSKPRILSVGGAIGEIAADFAHGNTLGHSGQIQERVRVRNIYADVDINLSANTFTEVKTYLIDHAVGGIVGRVRGALYTDMPLYTVYTGTVNAPYAAIGPCWGVARTETAATDNAGVLTSIYAGQVYKRDGSEAIIGEGPFSPIGSPAVDPNADRYFWNYRIINNITKPVSDQLITDVAPAGTDCAYGTRTLVRNYGEGSNVKFDPKNSFAMFQGVNHGSYADFSDPESEASQRMLEMFNTYANNGTTPEHVLVPWTYTLANKPSFNHSGFARLIRMNFTDFEVVYFNSDLMPEPLTGATFEWSGTRNDDTVDPLPALDDTNPIYSFHIHADSPSDQTKHPEEYRTVNVKVNTAGGDVYNFATEIDVPVILLKRTSPSYFHATVDCGYNDADFYIRWFGHDALGNYDRLFEERIVNESHFALTALDRYDKLYAVLYCSENTHPIRNRLNGFVQASISDLKNVTSYFFPEVEIENTENVCYRVRLHEEKDRYLTDREGRVIDPDALAIDPDPYQISYYWEQSADPSAAESWAPAEPLYGYTNDTNALFPAFPRQYYYRLTMNYHGAIVQVVQGPVVQVYVYDEAMTIVGRGAGITDFDGSPYPDGDDANSGNSPYTAVKTMRRAYELLRANDPAQAGAAGYEVIRPENNQIIVMGYIDDSRFLCLADAEYYGKPAKITGRNGVITNGALTLRRYEDYKPPVLQSAIEFSEITLVGSSYDSWTGTFTPNQLILHCNMHDITFGPNVKMWGYQDHSIDYGLIYDSSAGKKTYSPWFDVVVGLYNFNDDELPSRPFNAVPDVVSFKAQSGVFGRIIGANRNDGGATTLVEEGVSYSGINNKTYNICGSPSKPFRSIIDISISHLGDDPHEYSPGRTDYRYDVNLLVGGQTDGSCYADVEINLHNGAIGRLCAGNITYGRAAGKYHPSDSYYGNVVFNMTGGSLQEIYGASLGRVGGGTTRSSNGFYYYGRSILNIYGGVINNNVYGGGACCVAGLGTDFANTSDKLIPYYDIYNQLVYGTYEQAAGHMPSMILRDGSTLNLADFESRVNIYGGRIKGNVFGGGYGYVGTVTYAQSPPDGGNLYGNTHVLVEKRFSEQPVIEGNVFGGGGGSRLYYSEAEKAHADAGVLKDLRTLGCVYGNTEVVVRGGVIYGDVYAGSRGVPEYPTTPADQPLFRGMAAVYGDAAADISGDAVVMGDIFGGCQYGWIYRNGSGIEGEGGNTLIEVNGGQIGNNIYGGGRGSDEVGNYTNAAGKPEIGTAGITCSGVMGNTSVRVFAGKFLSSIPAEFTGEAKPMSERSFNIYGGGYLNAEVGGNTSVESYQSLLWDAASVGDDFMTQANDMRVRRFSVYGGGYGQRTLVCGNSSVKLDVQGRGFVLPNGQSLSAFVPGQVFFDVAAGGYSGDVGYWADADGNRSEALTDPDLVPQEYHHRVGGTAYLTISGYPYVRKVFGGGFFANVTRTDARIQSGTIRDIYGGCLLGYVFDRARTTLGTRLEIHDPDDPAAVAAATATAARANHYLWVVGNVYGGNDVKGIVGVDIYTGDKKHASDPDIYRVDVDGAPLYEAAARTDAFIKATPDDACPGVQLSVFGGNFKGNIYGAGNGYYRGYYVPGWLIYTDGNPRHYTELIGFDGTGKGLIYRTRPMTGVVRMHIGGNSATDRVNILGNVFGGGRSASIGSWDTNMPYDHPRRLRKGGTLQLNFGSHVSIAGNAYCGSEGANLYNDAGQYEPQQTLPADFYSAANVARFTNPDPAVLDELGTMAYQPWHWNSEKQRYEPGYAPPGKMYSSSQIGSSAYPQMPGEHMFRGDLKQMEMNGDVQVTFYQDPWLADGRRHAWLPAELAFKEYDIDDTMIDSFFLGGRSGSMTNNTLMKYQYNDDISDQEDFGTIYRLTLPEGLTLRDKVVCGSENARTTIYPYNDDFTALLKTRKDADDNDVPNIMYDFQGGMVTQSPISYDLIWYNANYSPDAPLGAIPEDFDESLITDSCITTDEDGNTITVRPLVVASADKDPHRLAVYDKDGVTRAYLGRREHRYETVVKLTTRCKFLLKNASELDPHAGDHNVHYGGLIFGGCYNSGFTMGDVVLNVGSDLMGDHFSTGEADNFNDVSTLEYNVGRVFGGGFGTETTVDGDTYINLLNKVQAMNVFGGGSSGAVTGSATINYFGNENLSFIYGAIYGGGLHGSVGTLGARYLTGANAGQYRPATTINLFSGNVDKVYGGSCIGNIYGQASILATDRILDELDHINYKRLVDLADTDGWSGSRLIVGSLFGGNDVAGSIFVADPSIPQTYIRVREDRYVEPSPAPSRIKASPSTSEPTLESTGPGKTSPGAHNGYNGFPLIGNLYGGSNGEYGPQIDTIEDYYTEGIVTMSNGNGLQKQDVQLGGNPSIGYGALRRPHIASSKIEITGGTVVFGYGGGNRATITDKVDITVNYNEGNLKARAGFRSYDEVERLLNVNHLLYRDQLSEVLTAGSDDEGPTWIFNYQIHRLFGGNNNAEMTIQPTWHLNRGFIGSLYSGGNFGLMSYYDKDAEHPGLTLTIDSPDIHADNVYGGCRLGNVTPRFPEPAPGEDAYDPGNDFYGATVYIKRGFIGHVYGGNDVSGRVMYGTHVDIAGAISGDVYGAGNGNYLYYYDEPGTTVTRMTEMYDPDKGGRYFAMPRLDIYGSGTQNQAQRVLAINRYRPQTDRVKINVHGSEDSPVAIYGNIYCGGNSSNVVRRNLGSRIYNEILFDIGDYVTINGVFLGSDGQNLANGYMIELTEQLNDLDVARRSPLTAATVLPEEERYLVDNPMYRSVLDLYMRAVEINNHPGGFTLDNCRSEAYIGRFCVGGNSGSMMTDETIHLTFPETLTIFGSIVGGCNNANVVYNGTTHTGGLIKPLLDGKTDKVVLDVKNRFVPGRMFLPLDELGQVTTTPTLVLDYMVDENGKPLVVRNADDTFSSTAADYTGARYYEDGQCNIYGGCFSSGTTLGNIRVNLYSDMLDYSNTVWDEDSKTVLEGPVVDGEHKPVVRKADVVRGIMRSDGAWRSFDVVGAGYGINSVVRGNVHVSMLPAKSSETYDPAIAALHPSASSIFGGSRNGTVVGNTTVEVRDGSILTNVFGASEASEMFGSSSVIVGYPEYMTATTRGEYTLRRADNVSKVAREGRLNQDDNSPVVPTTVRYLPGDIVPMNVYDMIRDEAKGTKFAPANVLPSNVTDHASAVRWDDIDIHIGDHYSVSHKAASYFGHGNVYGGGFIPVDATKALAGKNTVLRFTSDVNLGSETVGFGGNSAVLIWDNKENADLTKTPGEADAADGSEIRDHIRIGTGHYVPVHLKAGKDKMGLYYYDAANDVFVHQPSGIMETDDSEHYFRLEADGGIYGCGRQVFVEGFRSVDLGYYGYADFTPQNPKLLNTLQRADVVTVRDCCLQLQGASDFTVKRTVNDTRYSINRVGELQMVSSLPFLTEPLLSGAPDPAFWNNITHPYKRSRNYLGFFNDVHYLGSYVSNVAFNAPNHTAEGAIESKSYLKTKHDIIRTYYAFEPDPEDDEETAAEKLNANAQLFKMRNVGTAANMIGINNGFSFRIQNCVSVEGSDGEYSEDIYFGPAFGVTEIKPLTLAKNEGGGYIYALNHHYDPEYDIDANIPGIEAEYPGGDIADQDFLQTTANFVFPGAAFLESAGSTNYNYIIDDCHPMSAGFDYYVNRWNEAHGSSPTPAPSRAGTPPFNVNDYSPAGMGEEVHYWFVNGTRYFYNLTLTGYTNDSSSKPLNFFLDNRDQLIMLPGLEPGTNVKVSSVIWDNHSETAGYECDITDLEKDYRLLLTIDHNTLRSDLEPSGPDQGGAFVAELPRRDYVLDELGNVVTSTTGDADPNSALNGVYGMSGATAVPNVPALGLRLVDAQDNRLADQPAAVGHEYWQKHLSDPHQVTIVLTADVTNDQGQTSTFEYNVNLTINYLLGPAISGHVLIENCALPGELIFANAHDVVVDMDATNMAVTEQSWYLFPLREDGTVNEDVSVRVDRYKATNTDLEVEVPAYYYQNGWELRFGVVANGEPIFAYTDRTDPDKHHNLEIHNYHRMSAWDRISTDEDGDPRRYDLKLVPGARVYIEDNQDIQYFFQYLMEHQTDAAETLAEDGFQVIGPKYLSGLDFYLQKDVQLPPSEEMAGLPEVVFGGKFHGNGRIVHIGDNTCIPLENRGMVFDCGFVSTRNNPSTIVFNTNTGSIYNSYYYNKAGCGHLAKEGMLVNCYQNTPAPTTPGGALKFDYHELLSLSTEAFHYGQVAYNLNGYYLEKRAKLLSMPGTVNTPESLIEADVNARGVDEYAVSYIEKMFNNGDYQYAFYSAHDQFTEALRTEANPNYFNKMGNKATHHDTAHPHDPARWNEDEQINHPRYDLDDYHFFGQDLSGRPDPNHLPDLFTPETRVYRAGGFYGDMVDRGFFFNKKVYISSPLLTAIDVTGYRDNDPALDNKGGYRGWFWQEGPQEIYYPPTLDMPWAPDGSIKVDSYGIDPVVSRNILIYSPATDASSALFHYQDDLPNKTDYTLGRHDQTTILGHHIVSDGINTPSAYKGLVHLVDSYEDADGNRVPNDFNVPIEFTVADNVWLQRVPQVYNTTGSDGWESLALPFTAHHVYAVSEANLENEGQDHREVTHFYGPEPADPAATEADSHEYWLRKFTAVTTDDTDPGNPVLCSEFHRPGSTADRTANAAFAEQTRSYNYHSYFFTEAYYDYESWGHDLPQYSNGSTTFANYPMITERIPYLISFPGDHFYEFDFTGTFYAEQNDPSPIVAQRVSYISPKNATIKVTDLNPPHTVSHDGYDFRGTYRAINVKDATIATVDPAYQGAEFHRASLGDVVLPFRAYMTKTSGSPMNAPLSISRNTDSADPDEDSPADELASAGFEVSVQGRDLVIKAPHKASLVELSRARSAAEITFFA